MRKERGTALLLAMIMMSFVAISATLAMICAGLFREFSLKRSAAVARMELLRVVREGAQEMVEKLGLQEHASHAQATITLKAYAQQEMTASITVALMPTEYRLRAAVGDDKPGQSCAWAVPRAPFQS